MVAQLDGETIWWNVYPPLRCTNWRWMHGRTEIPRLTPRMQ